MQAALLFIALSLPGQVEPPRGPLRPPAKADPAPNVELPRTFSLDEIAAGAKNDAFVDEFLKDKQLTLFGQVQRIERVTEPSANDADPLAKPLTTYRLVMQRLGHEDRAVDIQVYFVFAANARKDLALLEPGVTKVTARGKCVTTQMQSLERGLNFTLELHDCHRRR